MPTEPKRFLLNSGEELFTEIRDKNFNAVGPTLSRKAKFLSAQFDVRKVLYIFFNFVMFNLCIYISISIFLRKIVYLKWYENLL